MRDLHRVSAHIGNMSKPVPPSPVQPVSLDRQVRSDGPYPTKLNLQIHGLRGLSALAVFVYHMFAMSMLFNFWPSILARANTFFKAGAYGVEIFFIISGYLITASLIRHQSARKFLIDRGIRIYPVFLAIHLLVFTIGPMIGYKWMAGISALHWSVAFISNALFLPGIFPLPLAQLNAWSLSYEAAFYLECAGVFAAAAFVGRRLVIWGSVLILIPALLMIPRASFFVVGVAIFFVKHRGTIQVPRIFRWLAIPCFAAVPVLLTFGEYHRALTFAAMLPALVFFWSIVEGQGALSAILRLRWLQYLGTISYSFYLWSPVVTYPLKIIVSRIFRDSVNNLTPVLLFTVTGTAAAITVSHFSYRYLEEGCGQALRRWTRARESSKTDSAAVSAPATAATRY